MSICKPLKFFHRYLMGYFFLYAVYRELSGNYRASIFFLMDLMKNGNFDRARLALPQIERQ